LENFQKGTSLSSTNSTVASFRISLLSVRSIAQPSNIKCSPKEEFRNRAFSLISKNDETCIKESGPQISRFDSTRGIATWLAAACVLWIRLLFELELSDPVLQNCLSGAACFKCAPSSIQVRRE